MITEQEYKEILPHRDALLRYRNTGSYNGGDAIFIADKLRQRYSFSAPINYNCSACKAAGLNDLYEMMNEYEQINGLLF